MPRFIAGLLFATALLLSLGRPVLTSRAAELTPPQPLSGPVIDQTILPQTSVWYTFVLPSDGSAIGLTLDYAPVPAGDTMPTLLIGFNVYQPDGKLVGRSTDADGGRPGHRFWLGGAGPSGTWLLQVINHSSRPVVYTLVPSSSTRPRAAPGIPPAQVQPTISPEDADWIAIAQALGHPAYVSSRPGATSPANAPIVTGLMDGSVPAGQSRWYRFWYSGLRGPALIGIDFGDTPLTDDDSPRVNLFDGDGQLVGTATSERLPGNRAAFTLTTDRYGYYDVELKNPGPRGANYRLVVINRH